MMMRSTSVVLFGACAALLSGWVCAAEHSVSSAADVQQAMRAAAPGDTLVMADGAWKDQAITFAGKGTAEKPITMRAQTPGGVRLEGNSHLLIDGEHLVVSGIFFGDSKSTDDIVQIKGEGNRFTDSAIIAPSRGGKWIHFLAGQHNRVDHCYIEGHVPEDVRMQIEVDEKVPNEHQIDHNHFGPRPPLDKNGGETIRVGYSGQSMRTSRTLVEHNLFDRCDGEIEIISNKSCENVYRNNTFRDSSGCLTLRHGNRCTVDGNFFFGNGGSGKPTGGIRVIGEDHTIINNYFERTSGIAGGVIVLTTGIPDSELKGYFQIKKCLVAFNTFVDNDATCIVLDAGFGQKGRSLLPENVTIANNLMLPPTESPKPLVRGKEGSGFQWIGNLAQRGEIGSAGESGFQVVDLRLARIDDMLRPSDGSPARGAAKGEFAKVTSDIDGQPRPREKADVGCDQASSSPVTNKPLTAADVGPSWRSQLQSQAKN